MTRVYDIDPSCQIPCAVLAELYDCQFGDATGCYVEVGAFDGLHYGHTSALAKLGWRGLCIEPHPAFAELCRQNHVGNNVAVDVCAVGAAAGTTKLFVRGEVSSIMWTEGSRAWGLDENDYIVVPVFPLDEVLQRNQIKPRFELLTIDVEEAELEVLAGFTLSLWQPAVVIVETHEMDPAAMRNWKAAPITAFFEAGGYTKVFTDHINSIFVRAKR